MTDQDSGTYPSEYASGGERTYRRPVGVRLLNTGKVVSKGRNKWRCRVMKDIVSKRRDKRARELNVFNREHDKRVERCGVFNRERDDSVRATWLQIVN